MIADKLMDEMKVAMKSGDKARLGVIRMMRAELKNAEIAAGKDLDDEEAQKVLMSYAKKRKESRAEYEKAGRSDLADKEAFEHTVVMEFLPKQLDEAELTSIVKAKIEETGAKSAREFGVVMKAVMAEVGSRTDGSAVSTVVKKLLAG